LTVHSLASWLLACVAVQDLLQPILLELSSKKLIKEGIPKIVLESFFCLQNWACRPGIDSSWNCLQMAARETGIGAVETFMHAGKLLALDLLVKVLENQGHTWSHVRQEVCPAG